MAFVHSDAWVLVAAVYARKPADRPALVAAGDYVNNAVLTTGELEGGLRRLTAAGYLREEAGGFVLGPAGAAVETAIATGGRGIGRAWDVRRAMTLAEAELGVTERVSQWGSNTACGSPPQTSRR